MMRARHAVFVLLAAAAGSWAGPAWAQAPASQASPRIVEVRATRFAFDPAEIDATEGEALRIVVRSGDGLHGFSIPDLAISREVPPGAEPVVIEFTPAKAGRFPI